jgi:hypothetical protein
MLTTSPRGVSRVSVNPIELIKQLSTQCSCGLAERPASACAAFPLLSKRPLPLLP